MRPIGGELVTTITSPSCWGTHFLYLSQPPSGNLLPIIPCVGLLIQWALPAWVRIPSSSINFWHHDLCIWRICSNQNKNVYGKIEQFSIKSLGVVTLLTQNQGDFWTPYWKAMSFSFPCKAKSFSFPLLYANLIEDNRFMNWERKCKPVVLLKVPLKGQRISTTTTK